MKPSTLHPMLGRASQPCARHLHRAHDECRRAGRPRLPLDQLPAEAHRHPATFRYRRQTLQDPSPREPTPAPTMHPMSADQPKISSLPVPEQLKIPTSIRDSSRTAKTYVASLQAKLGDAVTGQQIPTYQIGTAVGIQSNDFPRVTSRLLLWSILWFDREDTFGTGKPHQPGNSWGFSGSQLIWARYRLLSGETGGHDAGGMYRYLVDRPFTGTYTRPGWSITCIKLNATPLPEWSGHEDIQ